jgi:S1-C subfamily serine protease
MRLMAACFGSALIASVMTSWLLGGGHDFPNTALAQSLPPLPKAKEPAREREREPTLAIEANAPASAPLTPDEAVNIAVYERCNKSVVNISTVTVVSGGILFGAVPSEGNGSGSVLDKEGHILTNYHVIDGAQRRQVTLFNEEQYEAELVGADMINDIAVLKIKAPPEQLFPMELGSSTTLKVGTRVFALGNPFGLFRTMSEGIISSLNRSLSVQENWEIKSIIQIDCSINPGNSGGPLLDSLGRLIGMNTAIASKVQQSAGIGFAIPVELINRVVPELIEHGRVYRGDIGITHVTITEGGLRIAHMTPGGPAERAGLRGPKVVRQRLGVFTRESIDKSVADIITAIDGVKVTSPSEFLSVMETKKPGDTVELTVLRDGHQAKVKIKLASDGQQAEAKF